MPREDGMLVVGQKSWCFVALASSRSDLRIYVDRFFRMAHSKKNGDEKSTLLQLSAGPVKALPKVSPMFSIA